MKKFKLLSIIDTHDYTLNEIYQGQLYERMQQLISVDFITLDDILKNKSINFKDYDVVYCSLKIRNTLQYLRQLSTFLNGHQVIIQDYDPWVNYIDDSPYKNCYSTINSSLNVKSFFVSAKFWSDKLNVDNIKSTPIKLGMLSKHVHNPTMYPSRTNLIEFRGSKHPLRIKGMNELINATIPVNWGSTIKPYSNFLNHLQTISIWAHNELFITVNNQKYEANSLWPKALEVLSQGCFLLRDKQSEAMWYDMYDIPSTFLFDDVKHAKLLYEQICNMSIKEKNERITYTINFIKNKDYFSDIIHQIIECARS